MRPVRVKVPRVEYLISDELVCNETLLAIVATTIGRHILACGVSGLYFRSGQ